MAPHLFHQSALLVGMVLMGTSPLSQAAYITREFSGTLSGYFEGNSFPGPFQAGDPFTLSVGINNDAGDFNSAIQDVGLYLLDSATLLSATILDSGGILHVFTAEPTTGYVLIYDNYLGISRVGIRGSTASELPYLIIDLALYDDYQNVISSDRLSDLNLYGNWSRARFEISSPYIGGGGVYANFSPAGVPEPATLTLLGLGLVALGVMRRPRHEETVDFLE